MSEFDPNKVTITYNFYPAQIDLLLKGLSKLTVEEAGDVFFGIRQGAIATIEQARAAHAAQQAPAETPTNTTQETP